MSDSTADKLSGKEWFGHPRGLMTLFFTELWERFSYYGMRGILTLYLVDSVRTGGMGMDTKKAAAIYGIYTSMVYLLALPGGWVADKVIGQRNAVLIGGIIIAAGHFSMALLTPFFFFLGLILIVIGTGLLKPNVSAIVGQIYPEGGARRDAGFTIFYMGINVGATLGPLVCGLLGETVSWHFGFAAAGVGMIFGLAQYVLTAYHLGDAGKYNEEENGPGARPRAVKQLLAGIGVVFAIIGLFFILHTTGTMKLSARGVAEAGAGVIVSLAIAYFVYVLFFGGLDQVERKRVVVIFILFIGAAIFWGGFEQAGSSMNIFAKQLTNRELPWGSSAGLAEVGLFVKAQEQGFIVPASWLQSINPIFIIMLAPVFGWLWVWLNARQSEPSIGAKFGIGLVLLGAGFAVVAWGSLYTESLTDDHLVSPMWLVVMYFLHTVGELCLSPVGLSSVTKLSPKRLVGQMMGIWFMGAALGNLVAGLIAGYIKDVPLPELLGGVCLATAGAGVLFILFAGQIKKLTGGVE